MGLFKRLSNGWKLGKMSLSVIRENPSLMLFPVISGFSLFTLAVSFFGGGYFLFGADLTAVLEDTGNNNLLLYGVLFVFYFINYFIVVFFNIGLVHCARMIFEGKETSVGDGIRFASSRFGTIVSWAFLAATVGLILNTLQERLGTFGKIITGIIGMVWSIATFFVVPILAYEDVSPFEAVKRSSQIIKEKWGESLGANVSFGFFYLIGIFLIALPSGFVLGYFVHPIAGLIVGFALMMWAIIAVAASETVFLAAVYQHTNHEPVGKFNAEVLDDVFYRK